VNYQLKDSRPQEFIERHGKRSKEGNDLVPWSAIEQLADAIHARRGARDEICLAFARLALGHRSNVGMDRVSFFKRNP
jgi:hypothetical protein